MMIIMKKNWFLYTICCLFGLLAVSCQEDDEMGNGRSTGYLRLQIATNTSMATKAEEVYNPKQLAVKVVNSEGESVWDTDDWTTIGESQNIKLPVGTYTVQASSAGFDGKTSAYDKPYYAGSVSDVMVTKDGETTAKVVCTLANVKVTVNFADDFKTAFKTAAVTVGGLEESADPLSFTMGGNEGVGYFPVTDIYAKIAVVNQSDVANNQTDTITGVQARDHYIFNYTIAATGSGSITIDVDASTKTYTYHFAVPTTAKTTITANAWSSFAYLEAKLPSQGGTSEISKMKFQYKVASEGDEAWKDVENTISYDETAKVYKTTLSSLTPATEYDYRLMYNNEEAASTKFTTEAQTILPNSSFDVWNNATVGSKKDVPYPVESLVYGSSGDKSPISFWDSGNAGGALMGAYPTQKFEENGKTGAILSSQFIGVPGFMGKFAAGNIYTGHYYKTSMSPMGAQIFFGQPFTSRPTQLKGRFKYSRGTTVDYGEDPYKSELSNSGGDQCGLYIALTDNEGLECDGNKYAFEIDNLASADDADHFKYKNTIDFSEKNKNIVAYGTISETEAKGTGEWQDFVIDLKYRDLTRVPKYIIVVASASKYGDFFTGSTKSVMYIDDFELVYGDSPVTE